MIRKLYILIVFFVFISCNHDYESSNLIVEKIAPNTYQHTSFFKTHHFGKMSCNGLVVVDKKEALIFDTPINNKASKELINWVKNDLKCKIVGVIPTHSHVDCLGGLNEFHKSNIPSYANKTTCEIVKEKKQNVPKNAFTPPKEFSVGKHKVVVDFLGEGHSKDNIIAYYAKDKILFGGCLIKEMSGEKGNLADANQEAWPTTVEHVKNKYSEAEIIVPGHGKRGGKELLDYTIELFKTGAKE